MGPKKSGRVVHAAAIVAFYQQVVVKTKKVQEKEKNEQSYCHCLFFG